MKILQAFLTIIILSPISALADPITFVFEMPPFIDGSVDFEGQTSILEVTVDNGGTSAANQIYFNTDVTGLAATVGALFLDLNVFDHRSIFEGSLPYIVTNDREIPILDLSAMENSAVFLSNIVDFLQIGTADDHGPTIYHVDIGDSFGISARVVDVRGTRLTSIPEPGTLTLFGVGLIGLAFARRMR